MIDFSRFDTIGIRGGRTPIPYLSLNEGEDEKIEFLFTYKGEHQLIARGNLQLIKGKEKTGKSAMGIALIVAALGGSFLQIQPNGVHRVLWVDTEQDKQTLRERVRAALSMANMDDLGESVSIVTLKGENIEDRLTITIDAIKEQHPDFVFIDGAVDLCEDFNDNKSSRNVVEALLKATEQHNVAILCVVHTNKGDNEARGHLGTILQQKCSEVYEVAKDGDTATVKQDKSRFKDIPDIHFKFGDDFTLSEAEYISKDEAKRRELLPIFESIFDGVPFMNYAKLCEAYSTITGKGTEQARKDIKDAVILNLLFRQKDGRESKYALFFPPEIGAGDTILAPERVSDCDNKGLIF